MIPNAYVPHAGGPLSHGVLGWAASEEQQQQQTEPVSGNPIGDDDPSGDDAAGVNLAITLANIDSFLDTL